MLALYLLLCGVLTSLAHEDVILSPPEGKRGQASLLLFAQGASIKTAQYVPLVTAIQKEVPFPLYVAIPQCFEDNCAVPLTLKIGMERVRVAVGKAGLKVTKKTFHAGHSLGGAMLPGYVKESSSDGMILMGAFLTREYKTGRTPDGRPQVEFPVPTLTVGAELDGLCRISRVAEALYSQVSFSADPVAAQQSLPVTVIEGMNHMLFASGVAPKFVAEHDLRSEVSEEEAHTRVAADVSLFLTALEARNDDDGAARTEAWGRLSKRVEESTAFVKPLVDALKMEGYFQFLPPCYCESLDEYGGAQFGTCESTVSCNGGTPWTGLYSQPIMGKHPGLAINAVDSIHVVTEEKPSCHLPHIHQSQYAKNEPNWANPGSQEETKDDLKFPPLCPKGPDGCELSLTTVTEPYYENSGEFDIWRIHFSVPSFDTGYLPISATELKTKLKSRQAIWEAAGVLNVTRSETDLTVGQGGSGDRCREINDAAISWARAAVGEMTLSRYLQFGQQLKTAPDAYAVCPGGPCWIWDPLRFKKDDEANTAAITAVAFSEPNTNPFPCGEGKMLPCPAGMHYCMLFSPARAVEWMFTDGLRNKYGYQPSPASAPLKFIKLGQKDVKDPAFLSFIGTDLFVTQFGEFGAGNVVALREVARVFDNKGIDGASVLASSTFETVGQGFTWPNMVELVPSHVFSPEERAALCGVVDCDVYIVPDGFLPPGHKTGAIYLQPSSSPSTKHLLAQQERDWFFHQAHFVDVDGDGLADCVAARSHVTPLGQFRGELVWFKHPSQAKDVTSPWLMSKISDGPDVITLLRLDEAKQSLLVFSGQFFSSKLTVTSLQLGSAAGPKVACVGDIDSIKAEDVQFIDLDKDGQAELVVNSHEGGDGGSIYSYSMPAADTPFASFCAHDWAAGKRVVAAKGAFKVTKRGIQQAAPGFFYPIFVNGATGLLVAGDGSQAVHLVSPSSAGAFDTSTVLNIGGTVGTLAVGDVNNDGLLDLVVPDYDNNVIHFYSVTSAA